MGKEWYWRCSSRNEENEEMEAPGGCMSGMINFLDFHHLLFTTSTGCTRTQKGSSPQNQHYSPQSKGVEAPRNSLELDEVGEDYYGIPYGVHLVSAPSSSTKKIKKQLTVWVEEEKMGSEIVTPRTPNVVARLMGLEILPDGACTPTSEPISQYHSPKIITKKKQIVKKKHCVQQESRRESPPPRQPLQMRDCNIRFETAGSRSLPETPRVSSERSRDADPRLSLQLNKENHNRTIKEFSYVGELPGDRSLPPSPSPCRTNIRKKKCVKVQDANKSPGSRDYAREIVKQVKESISRRGSIVNGGSDEYLSKPRRSRIQVDNIASGDTSRKYSTARPSPSRSPPPPPPPPQEFHIPKPPLPPKPALSTNPPPSLPRFHLEDKEKISSSKCKRACYDRFNERIKKHTPPPATASKSPLSVPCNRLAVTPGKNFTTSDHGHQQPSSTLAIQEEKMYWNGSMKSTIINQKSFVHCRPKSNEQDPEFHYVRSILERAGIMGSMQVRWFSPSLPIDPFIFHQLELDLPFFQSSNDDDTLLLLGPIRHRCNRKLLFHLVEEILGELLGWSTTWPFSINQQQHKRLHQINKELLLGRLWTQIKGFPLADCRVIGDIDALVNCDLEEAKVRRLLQHPSVVAETEEIVMEIERNLLDSVLGEAATYLCHSSPAAQIRA